MLFRFYQVFTVFLFACFILASCEKDSDQQGEKELVKLEKALKNDFQIIKADKEDREISVDFSFVTPKGENASISDYEGQILVLNFWATWCTPCLKEMPDFEALHAKMKDYKFTILAIDAGETKEKVDKFLKKYPYSFQFGLDTKQTILEDYSIYGLPSTLVLDENGKILLKALGPKKWSADEVVRYFKRIANKKEKPA